MKTNKRKSTEPTYEYQGKPVGERWPINFTNPYWSKKLRMDYLQRRIIVYSIQYYELSDTCVDDKLYDAVAHQYLWYIRNSEKEEQERTTYWYVFYDFDGSTGFHLYGRLDDYDRRYLKHIAGHVLMLYRDGHKQGGKSKRKKV